MDELKLTIVVIEPEGITHVFKRMEEALNTVAVVCRVEMPPVLREMESSVNTAVLNDPVIQRQTTLLHLIYNTAQNATELISTALESILYTNVLPASLQSLVEAYEPNKKDFWAGETSCPWRLSWPGDAPKCHASQSQARRTRWSRRWRPRARESKEGE